MVSGGRVKKNEENVFLYSVLCIVSVSLNIHAANKMLTLIKASEGNTDRAVTLGLFLCRSERRIHIYDLNSRRFKTF